MKTYILGLKHDDGETSIQVRAASIQSAKLLVMELEGCPERAITYWRVVPTAAQIKKTKNLMRNL